MANRSTERAQHGNERSQTEADNFQSGPKYPQFKNNNYQSRADQLEERLIDFAVRIVRLSTSLPRTPAGKHIAGQILRSGTSPAPNYGEARGAESRADFVHKLRIVLKELNETSIWLRIIERSRMMKMELLAEMLKENKDLCRIFAVSLKTARTLSK
jgi:four helix bundle protein